ncbi:hypothetical protein [Actinoplanes awajinensis]|uniref:hypothetical protein n=1 Tax=Actinoplanes awajinensis TaxID=135946 RepID=UPI000A741595|nr:hypothetical protein [Actinoplanes awajinensis]
MTTADHADQPERSSDRLARLLGLPPRPPWTAEDEIRFREKMEKAERELAELVARRKAEAE